jgi:hypothetical protein
MEDYDTKLKILFDTKSADLTVTPCDILSSLVIDPKNEDQEFYAAFIRVIDDAALKHTDRSTSLRKTPPSGMCLRIST